MVEHAMALWYEDFELGEADEDQEVGLAYIQPINKRYKWATPTS